MVLGFAIGSASMATAAFSYKGWQRFSGDFRLGYLAGFFDMANLARNLDPGGFIDENYPVWPNVKLYQWREMVSKLYEDPENREYGMYAMMRLAGEEMKKKYGPAPTAVERLTPRFKEQVERARKAQEAKRAGSGDSKTGAPVVVPAPQSKTPATPRPSVWGHKKRRCPCPDEPKAAASGAKPGENGATAPASEPGKSAPSSPGNAAGASPSKP